MSPRLVLASTSAYRRELLSRLRVAFDVVRPDCDETPRPGEAADALAFRLARAKALAVAGHQPGACVIGSDQVAAFDDRLLGKPGGREAAIAQLQAMSGRVVEFHTAVCVVAPDGEVDDASDITRVHVRHLDDDAIARYVDAEQPFDCAGSFKCEGYGIALFDAIDTRDPTALIGLPLIATSRLLRAVGFQLP